MAWSEGGFVQDYQARRNIIQNLKCVDEVFTFNDSDGTVCQLLKIVKICYPHSDITYISEEDMHNMPETKIRGITFETMK
jgi:predicted RNA-binding protein with PUA-like domain